MSILTLFWPAKDPPYLGGPSKKEIIAKKLWLIYNLGGPSKKEIIAKRSIFQRKIWTNLEKIQN